MEIRGETPEWRPNEANGRQFLWMYSTPGLTPAIILEEARRLGLVKLVDFGSGELVEISVKLAGVTGAQSVQLRAACLARLGAE